MLSLYFSLFFFFLFFFSSSGPTNTTTQTNKSRHQSIRQRIGGLSFMVPPQAFPIRECALLACQLSFLVSFWVMLGQTELPSRSMYTNKLSVDRGRKKHQIQWLYICQIFNVLSLSYFYRSYVILRQQQRTKCLL